MGRKGRIAKFIKPFINKELIKNNYDAYIEPFVGGANMIDKITYKKKIGSDKNKYMIALFNGLKEGRRVSKFYTSEEYYNFRSKKDQYDDFEVGWVLLFYAFNSVFSGGYGGKFRSLNKTKCHFGAIKRIKSAIKQIPKLKNTAFYHRDYTHYNDFENCVFYLDPPYASTGGYVHVKGGEFNHDHFWDFARKLSKKNAVFISEYKAPNDFEVLWEHNKKLNSFKEKKWANKSTIENKTEKLFRFKL